MASTTCVAALAVVADQGNTFTSLTAANEPGSGLKLLRLLGPECAACMLGLVKGYTLALDGTDESLMRQISLLAKCKLSRLRVVLTADTDGGLGDGNGFRAS